MFKGFFNYTVEENIILDIGFGTGDSTIFLQQIFPQHKVYGIEAYKPGVKFLRDQKIGAEYGDAADIIEKFKNKTISQIYMLNILQACTLF